MPDTISIREGGTKLTKDEVDNVFSKLSRVCPECFSLIMDLDSDLNVCQQVNNFALTHISHLCAQLKE